MRDRIRAARVDADGQQVKMVNETFNTLAFARLELERMTCSAMATESCWSTHPASQSVEYKNTIRDSLRAPART